MQIERGSVASVRRSRSRPPQLDSPGCTPDPPVRRPEPAHQETNGFFLTNRNRANPPFREWGKGFGTMMMKGNKGLSARSGSRVCVRGTSTGARRISDLERGKVAGRGRRRAYLAHGVCWLGNNWRGDRYLSPGWGKRTAEMRRFDSEGSDEEQVSGGHWLSDCDSRVVSGLRESPVRAARLPGISVTACVIGIVGSAVGGEVRGCLWPPGWKALVGWFLFFLGKSARLPSRSFLESVGGSVQQRC